MAAYRWVSQKQLDKIVTRLQKRTVAYTASNADFDAQLCHVAYIQRRDPTALQGRSRKGSVESLEKITGRVTRPTTASTASRHDFDVQECHIDYLRKTLPRYPPEKRSVSSLDELTTLGEKLSKETAASKAARYDFDAQREHVKYLERIDPKYPGNKKYGFRCKSAPFKHVHSDAEIEQLNYRLTKPTVASEGGKQLQNKDFVYVIPKPSSTCPEVKGLDKKFKGTDRRAGSVAEVEALGEKLSKETAASRAARHDFDAQREHVKYLERIDPKYPGNKKYGFRCKSAPFKRVENDAELARLNSRLTVPTVASEGGKRLENKEFVYYIPPPSPTCPEVKGLDKKFRGTAKMTTERLKESVERLNRQHKRYQ